MLTSLEEKFMPEPNSGCWLWLAARSTDGYGQVRYKGRNARAHRAVYEEMRGVIPHGLALDHKCRNIVCVNPDHLEPVTNRENLLRSPITGPGRNVRKTHCLRGHEFTPENTLRHVSGGRVCLICQRMHQRNYALKKRARPRA